MGSSREGNGGTSHRDRQSWSLGQLLGTGLDGTTQQQENKPKITLHHLCKHTERAGRVKAPRQVRGAQPALRRPVACVCQEAMTKRRKKEAGAEPPPPQLRAGQMAPCRGRTAILP